MLLDNRDLLVLPRGAVESRLFYAALNRFLGVRTRDGNLLSKGFYKFILVEEPYVVDKFVPIRHNFSAYPTSELG